MTTAPATTSKPTRNRDGHLAEMLLEPQGVQVKIVCPHATPSPDAPPENVPACRVEYDEDGHAVPDAAPLNYCNLIEWLVGDGVMDCLDVPRDTPVPPAWPVPIEWWWDGLDETYLWSPILDDQQPGPEPEPCWAVLTEVAEERGRQDAKWGEQNHPDGTGDYPEIIDADAARMACQDAAEGGYVTWLHILREEVAEALAETDQDRLRTELLQVAAVAVNWIEALDRRASAAAEEVPA